MVVDTAVTCQRLQQQSQTVSTNAWASSSVPRPQTSSLSAKAAYLILFLYLCTGGFVRDMLGPTILLLESSRASSLAALGTIAAILLALWLTLRCILARSALSVEAEYRSTVLATSNVEDQPSSDDNGRVAIGQPVGGSGRKRKIVPKAASPSQSNLHTVSSKFVVSHIVRDAVMPFCNCSSSQWMRYVADVTNSATRSSKVAPADGHPTRGDAAPALLALALPVRLCRRQCYRLMQFVHPLHVFQRRRSLSVRSGLCFSAT